MNAFRKLATVNRLDLIHKRLKKINSTQTNFKDKQEVDLESFMALRDRVFWF